VTMRHLTDLDVSKIVTAVAALRDTSGRDRHARYILDYYRLDEKNGSQDFKNAPADARTLGREIAQGHKTTLPPRPGTWGQQKGNYNVQG
jgi:hypothetical protein